LAGLNEALAVPVIVHEFTVGDIDQAPQWLVQLSVCGYEIVVPAKEWAAYHTTMQFWRADGCTPLRLIDGPVPAPDEPTQ
jgi:hypothetical protein